MIHYHMIEELRCPTMKGSVNFFVRATPLPEDLSRFIVKCTEITELDEIYQEQERLAMIDSLTEIYNRLKFQKYSRQNGIMRCVIMKT